MNLNHPEACVFWFRRDLRLEDNHGLYEALKCGFPVIPIFIFDKDILDDLEKGDSRVQYIHESLKKIKQELINMGSDLKVFFGKPKEIFEKSNVKGVYSNKDYEPYAINRDLEIKELLEAKGISFYQFKDQVIFEKDEVLTLQGNPFSVYTPYSRRWKQKLEEYPVELFPSESLMKFFFKMSPTPILELEDFGFSKGGQAVPNPDFSKDTLKHYAERRDIPSLKGTTQISTRLRFGTLSIRKMVLKAQATSEKWLNELIWREFYSMILWNFPHVVSKPFRKGFKEPIWLNDPEHFQSWCEGRTGIPFVDAGMRELNETGLMHNRVRMITASFLVKNLLIDWRWGEAYFAKKLLDFELATNNGSWQWVAGTGADAAPYFRVFNPETQAKRFDPKMEYIRKWVPEFQEFNYPKPLVDLKSSRQRAIDSYKKAADLV